MKNRSFRPHLNSCFFLAALALTSSGTAGAQAPGPASASALPESGPTDKDRIIADLLQRVEALERRLANQPSAGPAAAPTAPAGQVAMPAAPVAPVLPSRPSSAQRSTVPPMPASAGNTGSAVDEPADEETSRALERTLIREGGLVLPPKAFEVEPRLTFEHRSSNALQIVDVNGQRQISNQDVKRNFAEASLGFRAGLPWASQLEVVIPYSANRERRIIAGGAEQIDRDSGFGNFEIGLTKQLLNEGKGTPGLLGTLRWRGAGSAEEFGNPVAASSSFRSLLGAVTVVKRRDPMVFFGTLSHAVNYSKTINGADIDPGNSTGVRLGSIFAVSPDTSMRLGFDFSRSGEIGVNGMKVPGSDAVAGFFNTGFSFVLSPQLLLGVEAGFGLTPSAPDFRIGVSLPIRF